eukprot:2588968-Rhodomonas_salina.2
MELFPLLSPPITTICGISQPSNVFANKSRSGSSWAISLLRTRMFELSICAVFPRTASGFLVKVRHLANGSWKENAFTTKAKCQPSASTCTALIAALDFMESVMKKKDAVRRTESGGRSEAPMVTGTMLNDLDWERG